MGTIALWLSGQAKEVRGIDLNPEAIKNAKENAIKNKVTNASFYVGNVSGNLQQFEREGFVPDLLVVDPPRTGMDAKLLNYLQNNPVPRIIYVSCNPSTLAKNCSHLQSKYQILSVQPLDMFPQTAAVESVVLLQEDKQKKEKMLLEDNSVFMGDGDFLKISLAINLCPSVVG